MSQCIHELSCCDWCNPATPSVARTQAVFTARNERWAQEDARRQEIKAMPQVSARLAPVPTTARVEQPTRTHRNWGDYPRTVPTSVYPSQTVLVTRPEHIWCQVDYDDYRYQHDLEDSRAQRKAWIWEFGCVDADCTFCRRHHPLTEFLQATA